MGWIGCSIQSVSSKRLPLLIIFSAYFYFKLKKINFAQAFSQIFLKPWMCFTKYKSIVTEKEKTHKNVRSLIKILIKLRNSRSISTPLLKHTYHQIKVFWKLRILHKTNVPEVKERSSQPFLSQKTSIFKLQSNIFFLFSGVNIFLDSISVFG